ncbi:hypothetical protein BCR44DRAFT_49065 [Catenaria anguillulae PL171]|uniref:Uncharacterized protein n=1 Tax=Catenaria anguillulae PL171 TaxID=765915 RepID=A0A1Y2HUT5_9FUNG|nr:hypothetical protein BCR44DRAFT_49065 [Catenaria anguillulae PL171]
MLAQGASSSTPETSSEAGTLPRPRVPDASADGSMLSISDDNADNRGAQSRRHDGHHDCSGSNSTTSTVSSCTAPKTVATGTSTGPIDMSPRQSIGSTSSRARTVSATTSQPLSMHSVSPPDVTAPSIPSIKRRGGSIAVTAGEKSYPPSRMYRTSVEFRPVSTTTSARHGTAVSSADNFASSSFPTQSPTAAAVISSSSSSVRTMHRTQSLGSSSNPTTGPPNPHAHHASSHTHPSKTQSEPSSVAGSVYGSRYLSVPMPSRRSLNGSMSSTSVLGGIADLFYPVAGQGAPMLSRTAENAISLGKFSGIGINVSSEEGGLEGVEGLPAQRGTAVSSGSVGGASGNGGNRSGPGSIGSMVSLVAKKLKEHVSMKSPRAGTSTDASGMQFSNVGLKRAGFAGDVDVNAGRCLEMVPGSNTPTHVSGPAGADSTSITSINKFGAPGGMTLKSLPLNATGLTIASTLKAVMHLQVLVCDSSSGILSFSPGAPRPSPKEDPSLNSSVHACVNNSIASNWTRAQYWRAWANDKGRYRSHLDMNLCLDPAGGWNGDRNGQNLMLWHCHDGGEQEFAARPTGEFRTNLLWDMAKDCHSNDAFFCSFGCAGAGSETLVNVIFEGVKLACGWAKHPPVALACVSAAVVTQDTLPDWKDKCKCRCERWRQPPRPGPWANRTRPVLESRPLVTAVPEGSQHVELTIDGNVSRVISMTELVKENPHLKTLVVPAASPVLTHTVNVTATA